MKTASETTWCSEKQSLPAIASVPERAAIIGSSWGFEWQPLYHSQCPPRVWDGQNDRCRSLGYLDSPSLQADAALVLTDSGGLQEETTALGVPCLTLRENTERPITVDEGTNQVVGTDLVRIRTAASTILASGVEVRRPALWDGKAAERIAEVILHGGTAATRPRPTDLI